LQWPELLNLTVKDVALANGMQLDDQSLRENAHLDLTSSPELHTLNAAKWGRVWDISRKTIASYGRGKHHLADEVFMNIPVKAYHIPPLRSCVLTCSAARSASAAMVEVGLAVEEVGKMLLPKMYRFS
jgi:hypothetical protein